MTILIILLILLVIYFYWRSKQAKIDNYPANSPDILWEADNSFFPEMPKSRRTLAEQKDWFTDKRWLSDKEIDWALEQTHQALSPELQAKYKVLEATQFMFAKETLESKNDPDASVSFPTLLSELTAAQHDLVFIPVNNPDFHWSLLVYETKTKKFYHFDTLRGANDSYVQPLTKELLKFLLENWQDPQHHWETRYHLKQNNSWDCGIAVIEIAKQIMRDYPTYQRILMYTKLDFNFPQARINWRNKLNHA